MTKRRGSRTSSGRPPRTKPVKASRPKGMAKIPRY
jgi:hypothetical protein